MYDGIKFARAQPVHKVKADRDERSGEPAGNVRLKGCQDCVEATRAAVGANRAIDIYFARLLSVDVKRKKEKKSKAEKKKNHLFSYLVPRVYSSDRQKRYR